MFDMSKNPTAMSIMSHARQENQITLSLLRQQVQHRHRLLQPTLAENAAIVRVGLATAVRREFVQNASTKCFIMDPGSSLGQARLHTESIQLTTIPLPENYYSVKFLPNFIQFRGKDGEVHPGAGYGIYQTSPTEMVKSGVLVEASNLSAAGVSSFDQVDLDTPNFVALDIVSAMEYATNVRRCDLDPNDPSTGYACCSPSSALKGRSFEELGKLLMSFPLTAIFRSQGGLGRDFWDYMIKEYDLKEIVLGPQALNTLSLSPNDINHRGSRTFGASLLYNRYDGSLFTMMINTVSINLSSGGPHVFGQLRHNQAATLASASIAAQMFGRMPLRWNDVNLPLNVAMNINSENMHQVLEALNVRNAPGFVFNHGNAGKTRVDEYGKRLPDHPTIEKKGVYYQEKLNGGGVRYWYSNGDNWMKCSADVGGNLSLAAAQQFFLILETKNKQTAVVAAAAIAAASRKTGKATKETHGEQMAIGGKASGYKHKKDHKTGGVRVDLEMASKYAAEMQCLVDNHKVEYSDECDWGRIECRINPKDKTNVSAIFKRDGTVCYQDAMITVNEFKRRVWKGKHRDLKQCIFFYKDGKLKSWRSL